MTLLTDLYRDISFASWMPIVFSFLVSVGFLFTFSRRRRHGLPLSPWRLPLIGNLHQLTSLPHKGLYHLSQKYGPLMLVYFGSAPFFVISDGDLAREVTKVHDYVFSNRSQSNASRLLFSGNDDLLFSPNNNFWRQSRKMCVNELLSIQRVQSFRYILEEEVAELVAMIQLKCHVGRSSMDLKNSFHALANNIISRVVLGRKCIGEGTDNSIMLKLAKHAIELITTFSFGDFIPLLSGLDKLTGFSKKGLQTSKALHAFLDQVIDEHEAQSACHAEYGRNEIKDFVHIIIDLQKNDTNHPSFTRGDIKAILLDMFLGGSDTSATNMEWTMSELAKHPRIMKRVQDEIRLIVGDKQKISEHDISRMEYLHCVVKESLRLHCPFVLARKPSTNITIGQFEIPANSDVLMNTWAIHRDPNTWDTPLEFIPERFLKENLDYKGQDHKYIPFGAGRRSCPGAHFAVTEVEYTIANLLFWFNWELPDGMTEKDFDMSVTGSQISQKKIPLCLVPVQKTS